MVSHTCEFQDITIQSEITPQLIPSEALWSKGLVGVGSISIHWLSEVGNLRLKFLDRMEDFALR